MRFAFAGLFACALSVVSVQPVAAQDGPRVLTPSSPWNVDFAPTSCRLARVFGEGDDLHVLFFEQYFPSERAGLTVAGPALNRFRDRTRTATMLSFFASQEPLETEPFTGDVDSVGKALIYSSVDLEHGTENAESDNTGLPQLDTQFAQMVEYVRVKQRSRDVRFDTGPLDEAFAVLNTCTQDMVRDWGLDVEEHLNASSFPVWTNRDSVVRRISAEYPRSALGRGEQAIMRMRVIVDEEGKVADCRVDNATDTERLQSPACEQMQQAEFEPALDRDGQPFRSYFATSIVYQIGGN